MSKKVKQSTKARNGVIEFLRNEGLDIQHNVKAQDLLEAIYKYKDYKGYVNTNKSLINLKIRDFYEQEVPDAVVVSPSFNEKKKKKKKVKKKTLNKPAYQGDYKTKTRLFYKSSSWQTLRYIIIRKHKGCCVICGRNRKEHGVVMHCDHIVPLSKDWSLRLDEDNIQLLCEDCNLGKSNTDSIDWR